MPKDMPDIASRSTRIRASSRRDMAAVRRVLALSYGALLPKDYPQDIVTAALPVIGQANPALVGRAGYFIAETDSGRAVAVGGWTPGAAGVGHVRHVACDPGYLRRGYGRALMARVLDEAEAFGVRMLCCLSTRGAVGFYGALGFEGTSEVEVRLAPGVYLPAVEMRLHL
ncbi:GNAT family N-acetyltransferase [Rhodalgimonas zhirmunskyi]|uniref:GNAT family N-acetyltransferase n=1 Tax=Rhodalgimonas zhirmunskyi TaxID=2964767 RepID=A0AAJ1UEW4_9RHOB|nr:GNAT family N-acetyltransferase [Rhodoalgimonas zhirmunskyi]MDQ2094991.1 GNAT family N-acetyltransferase [Rhodoalgimonas zhirmunskyi]